MRKFLIAGACIGLLIGCAQIPAINSAANQPVAGNTSVDEKVMYSGEQAYNFIAKTYLDAVGRKLVTGATKDALKAKVQLAYKYLVAMRTAKAALDAKTLTDKYAALLAVKGEVCTLTGKVCV